VPDVMAEGVKCVECHASIARGHSPAEIKKACVQCHEPRYEEITDGWQKEVSERTERLKRSVEAWRVRKKGVPNPEKEKIEALTGEVEEVLKAIDEDKSKGVHNFIYAKKLMSEAEKKALATFSKGLQ
jgi:hypothetical protein